MRILIGLVILLIITGTGISTFAMEVSGTLTVATWKFIIVDRDKYPVTDKTIIADKDSIKDTSPYDPGLLRDKKRVIVIIEHREVKKILIEVPK